MVSIFFKINISILCRRLLFHICFIRQIIDLSVGNGDLDLHTGLDADGGDLLDDLGGRVEIDDALVDAHLETIPGLGTLSARSLPGGDAENLGRHADGALDLQLFLLGTPVIKKKRDFLEI